MFIFRLYFWVFTLAFSVIPGVIIGCLFQAMFGPWCYWVGYAIGMIGFFIVMSPMLFVNSDVPDCPGAEVTEIEEDSKD